MPSGFHLIRNILKGHKQSAATRRGGMLLLLTQPLSVNLALFHLGSESESECCSVVSNSCDPMDYTVHGILQARMLEWVAFPFSRGSSQPRDGNPGLPHCRGILYQLSHKGSPRRTEWVAYPFSSGSSHPRNGTGVSCIASGLFTN